MNILIYNEQNDLVFDEKKLEKIVSSLLDHLKVQTDEVSINFVDVQRITELHGEYFDDPTPTDCITFPLEGDASHKHILGEIFVCPKVAIEYAIQNNLDPQEENLLYVVHGILHLLGYDDIEEKEREEMRKKEKSCMDYIKQHIG